MVRKAGTGVPVYRGNDVADDAAIQSRQATRAAAHTGDGVGTAAFLAGLAEAWPCLRRMPGGLLCRARKCGLVDANTPSPSLSRRIFMRSLISGLGQPDTTPSVGYNLRALRQVASSIRERFSQAHWQLIEGTEAAFRQGCADTARGRCARIRLTTSS